MYAIRSYYALRLASFRASSTPSAMLSFATSAASICVCFLSIRAITSHQRGITKTEWRYPSSYNFV